jgi:ABC-type uncharacterized transport system substrate-binding protein
MKRREFIILLGSTAVWPLTARAQQPSGMRRIAVLLSGNADGQTIKTGLEAFEQGLQQLGWTEGRNVRIEFRGGAGDADLIRKHAAELAVLAPDAIVAVGTATGPMLQATRIVPIVFVFVPDPVGSGFVEVQRDLIVALAAQHKLPAIYTYRDYVTAGGLISYGTNIAKQFRLAAGYADRILKGEKPADLPVQVPTKFDLVVNLKTAKALDLTVPPAVLARADEVIE